MTFQIIAQANDGGEDYTVWIVCVCVCVCVSVWIAIKRMKTCSCVPRIIITVVIFRARKRIELQ